MRRHAKRKSPLEDCCRESRSTRCRRRKREGLEQVWLPRSVLEEAAVDAGIIGEWDVDTEEKLRKALRRYLIELSR
jgi:hypothetical protein